MENWKGISEEEEWVFKTWLKFFYELGNPQKPHAKVKRTRK
jgi:hypothetical protein